MTATQQENLNKGRAKGVARAKGAPLPPLKMELEPEWQCLVPALLNVRRSPLTIAEVMHALRASRDVVRDAVRNDLLAGFVVRSDKGSDGHFRVHAWSVVKYFVEQSVNSLAGKPIRAMFHLLWGFVEVLPLAMLKALQRRINEAVTVTEARALKLGFKAPTEKDIDELVSIASRTHQQRQQPQPVPVNQLNLF